MLRDFVKRLNPRRYDLYRDEVYTRNGENLAPFITVGVGVMAFDVLVQLFIERIPSFPMAVVLLGYFVLLALVYMALRGRLRATTPLMYGVQVPAMLLAIYMGTVYDPNTPTITFLMFIVTLPLFLLDKAWRVVLYDTVLVAVYVALAVAFDNPAVLDDDLLHVVSFWFASVMMSLFVLGVRFESVENRCKLRGRAEHDELTGLKNRFAWRSDFATYQRVPICLLMCDIDLFKRFNDEYGHAVGDEVIVRFAHTFEDEFGQGTCYRYGGDEMLVVVRDMDAATFEEHLRACQQKLRRVTLGGQIEGGISCSCGYCHGQARNGEDLRAMLNVADEQLYAVKEAGRGGIRGAELTPADVERLAERRAELEDDPRGNVPVSLRNHEDRRS